MVGEYIRAASKTCTKRKPTTTQNNFLFLGLLRPSRIEEGSEPSELFSTSGIAAQGLTIRGADSTMEAVFTASTSPPSC